MTVQAPDTVSIPAFGKRVGVSDAAVREAITDGRLYGNALHRWGKGYRIVPEIADLQWNALRTRDPGALPDRDNDEPVPFAESRAARERYNAELTRLELEEKRGNLVDVVSVRKTVAEAGRTVLSAMLAIPDRVSDPLAAETDRARIHHILTEEIRKACESLANGFDRAPSRPPIAG